MGITHRHLQCVYYMLTVHAQSCSLQLRWLWGLLVKMLVAITAELCHAGRPKRLLVYQGLGAIR